MAIVNSVEVIGPTEAATMLGEATTNRRMSAAHLLMLTRAMEEGAWDENEGSPIRFDVNGNLCDGQHRLQAVINSGCEYIFHVQHGTPIETMMVIDNNRSRTTAHYFELQGEKYSVALASAAFLLCQWTSDSQLYYGRERHEKPSRLSQVNFLNDNPSLRLSVSRGELMRHLLKGGGGKWGALCFILTSIDETDADWFLEHLHTGIDLPEGHPILALRKILLDTSVKGILPNVEYCALVFKAWNLYREGRSVIKLSWRRGGAAPEAYPSPI